MNSSLVHPLEFRGNGWEYSKIYFVNLALTILTLGIYSAWAKVRNKRYFYGNTSLAGAGFEYHASPVQILKGRILVVAAFVLYNFTVGAVPELGLLFIGLFLFALPWLVLKATQFNMRNSSYRQIRFDFLGELGALFKYYVVLPVASAFTLWLAYPYAAFKQKEYYAQMSRFGQSRFDFNGSSSEFFKTYFTAVAGMALFLILLGFALGDIAQSFMKGFQEGLAGQQVQQLVPSAAPQEAPDPKAIAAVMVGVMAFYAGIVLLGIVVMTYINTRITNYFFNSLKLNGVRFKATIGYWRLMWIYLSNLILIFLTFGLYIPWAKVRAVKYKLGCITVIASDLDGHIASEAQQMKALGEEASDFLDVDVGF